MARVETVNQMREIYRQPKGRAAQKVIPQLEKHSKHIIELSPFMLISTTGEDGIADVSPRGDAPGFVKTLDDQTIAIPDRPGNNRLDTLTNILANPAVGTIFFVPGVDEVLRINGDARRCRPPRAIRDEGKTSRHRARHQSTGDLFALREGNHALRSLEVRNAGRALGAADHWPNDCRSNWRRSPRRNPCGCKARVRESFVLTPRIKILKL